MRIIEEQKNPTEEQEKITNNEGKKHLEESDDGIAEPKRKYRKRKSKRSCLGSLGCLAIALVLILSCIVYSLWLFGPLMEKADNLPKDFPNIISLYQADKAEILIQDPEDKEKALKLIRSLPEWILLPLSGYFSTEGKTQALSGNPEIKLDDVLKLSDLERALSDNAKTVSLSWDGINKTKEELADYYESQLKMSGLKIEKNISDYEIKLRFIDDGLTGAIAITDSFYKDNNSIMKMTVNYIAGE